MNRWCDTIAPVTIPVRCGDAVHLVSWRRGKLVLEDHDLTAERSLGALGGEPCPCVRILQAWSGPATKPSELVQYFGAIKELLQRPTSAITYDVPDIADVVAPSASFSPRAMTRAARARIEQFRREQGDRFVRWTFPTELLSRYVLGVVVRCGRQWESLGLEEQWAIQDRLIPRAETSILESITSWCQVHAVNVHIEGQFVGPHDKPAITGYVAGHRGEAFFSLPLTWAIDVWAAGRAVVDGCFVLEATDGPGGAEATVVRWERLTPAGSEPVAVPARLWHTSEGAWRLRFA